MSRELIEIIILGAIAGFVIARLYATFGRRSGAEPPPAPAYPLPRAPEEVASAPSAAAPHGGLGEVVRLDPAFDAAKFLDGARKAYEMIVQSFAAGDRATLQGLLNPRVYAAYDAAIAARRPEDHPPELLRLRRADLVDAAVAGSFAKVIVRFEAELAQGATGLRETQEKWTFERDMKSADPNWRLAGVAQA